ncbi:hypothetical protein [Sodaliphilus pleomorphus]|uniref:Uncharacterized protein n=1 Tax=Sodaliphilus pleomorphus TaxID=2606626 RepID=A0A6L5XBB3_9BACT|nr:hypothetical protein [Sodaliphilus pleomorphus]MSS16805.1 hypothetical protein [Sodaliphilus pleomorphus]
MTIETAWVGVPSMRLKTKEMRFEDVKSFAKMHKLGVYNSLTGKVDEVDGYLKPATRAIRTYGFYTGSYVDSPEFDLVPFGTTVEFGMYVFPKKEV